MNGGAASGVLGESPPVLSLSVVVLSFNRREALRDTLRSLHELPLPAGSEVIVVDNASSDGSAELVRTAFPPDRFPHVRLIELAQNVGVAGFNRGAEAARGDVLLILDDDACPSPGVLDAALAFLREHRAVGAVALAPFHPRTGAREWPFARARTVRFPFMGCGNLVRAHAWRVVGGYEEAFFLYRNDTDLAMKLLGAGFGVACDPAWTVAHDSPFAASKSERWLHGATRNWIWLCRRHCGKGVSRLAGLLAGGLGTLWALKLAGLHWSRLRAAARGAWEGVSTPAPPLPGSVVPTGQPLWDLLSIRLRPGRP